MATPVRVTIIGAGSAQFCLGLVRDICLTPNLHGSSIALMDVDAERLELVAKLARRYAEELDADLCFEQTADLDAALGDADFVINTALNGGHSREEAERALLEQHGYYRGLHPGEGFFYQLDLMLRVARRMERVCPGAWLIQSSNPVLDGCNLMTRETGIKVIGLCHGHYGHREIARTLGLDPDRVTWEAPGFNHLIWLTHFRYEGQDAYPLLDHWIAEQSESYWRNWSPTFHDTQISPAAIHMYRFYGLMPIGDTSRALWPEAWWYHQDLEAKMRWWGPLGGFDSTEGWTQYLDGLNERLKKMRAIATDPTQRVTEVFPPVRSREQIVPIMDALTNDVQGQFQVNVPNRGALPGFPDNMVVEVPAVIDGRGVRPLQVDPLPQRIMLGAMWPQWLAMERRLAAYLERDPRYIMQVLLSEQRTRSWEHAEETLAAILHMPGNEEMAAYFRD